MCGMIMERDELVSSVPESIAKGARACVSVACFVENNAINSVFDILIVYLALLRARLNFGQLGSIRPFFNSMKQIIF